MFAPIISLILVALISTPASAVPITEDVVCNGKKCGTMTIDKYVQGTILTSERPDRWYAGARIRGTFTSSKDLEYHYIQSQSDNSGEFRWIKDDQTPLPDPRIDAPPGGYLALNYSENKYDLKQKFDYFPWYDQSAYQLKKFGDDPMVHLLTAKDKGVQIVESFETWLVCVIKETSDKDQTANDDSYKISPLLGWTWGYTIDYKDIKNIGTIDIEDFTWNLLDLKFKFPQEPSDSWMKALTAKYGTGKTQDFWNIQLGNCTDCPVLEPTPIPEPSTLLLLGAGLAGVGLMRRRFKK